MVSSGSCPTWDAFLGRKADTPSLKEVGDLLDYWGGRPSPGRMWGWLRGGVYLEGTEKTEMGLKPSAHPTLCRCQNSTRYLFTLLQGLAGFSGVVNI